MTELLHPDGLPVSATPWIDRFHDDYCGGGISDVFSALIPLERMQRESETDAAEQRAWKEKSYTERSMVISAMTRMFPSYLSTHIDTEGAPPWDPEWRTVVLLLTPAGQLSYHLHERDVHLFAHLSEGKNGWDGHDDEEKNRRLLAIRGIHFDNAPRRSP